MDNKFFSYIYGLKGSLKLTEVFKSILKYHKVPMATKIPMATKFPKATKVPMITKVPMATKLSNA